jgi:hypothetical protein
MNCTASLACALIGNLTAMACVMDGPPRPLDETAPAEATASATTITLGPLAPAGYHLSVQTYDDHGEVQPYKLTAADLFVKNPNHSNVYTGTRLPAGEKLSGVDVLAPFDGTIYLYMSETGINNIDAEAGFKGVDITSTRDSIIAGATAFPTQSFRWGSGTSGRAFNFGVIVKAPEHYIFILHAENLATFQQGASVRAALRSGLQALRDKPKTGGQRVLVNTGIAVAAGTAIAKVGDHGRANGDPHTHIEVYRATTLQTGTVLAGTTGTSVDFSNASDITYGGEQIFVDALDSGLGASQAPSQYLYPAMPRHSFAVNATAQVDIGWAGLSTVALRSSANGATTATSLTQGTQVTITSAPTPAGQKLWYAVSSGGATGWLAAEHLKP